MTRNESVKALMEEHFDWDGDAMLVMEQGHKGDQKGTEKYYKHVYANVLQPAICPILALSVLTFSTGFRQSGQVNHQIYDGTNSKDRFSSNLSDTVCSLSEGELNQLGACGGPKDIATHSARKGAGTFCLGQVSGPTPIAVTLRLGHSLGKIKDKYIFVSEGADQFCGRMVNGSDFTSETFATLPPHFINEVRALLTDQFWETILPGYHGSPAGWKKCCEYLLASLLFHEDFLRGFLPENHPIWRSGIWQLGDDKDQLKNGILTGIGRCPHTGMTATGIPPHLAIAAQIKGLIEKIDRLEKMLEERMDNFEQRFPGQCSALIANDIRSQFMIEGVIPLSLNDLKGVMTSMQDDFAAKLTSFQQYMEARLLSMNTPSITSPSGWAWEDFRLVGEDRERIVPTTFIFPRKTTVLEMCRLWWYGDRSTGIRPYRHITPADLPMKVKDTMQLSRATKVMKAIQKIIEDNGFLAAGTVLDTPSYDSAGKIVSSETVLGDHAAIDKLTSSEFTVVYNKAYYDFILPAIDTRNGKSRKNDLTVGTAYNNINTYKNDNPDTDLF